MSKYKLYIGLNRQTDKGVFLQEIDSETNIDTYEKPTLSLNFNTSFELNFKGTLRENYESKITSLLFTRDSLFSCRESLINSIYKFHNAMNYCWEWYGRPVVFIQLFEDGTELHIKDLLKFSRGFLKGSRFEIVKHNFSLYLLYKFNGTEIQKDLWTLSLLLWLIRNHRILKDILTESDSSYLSNLLSWLAEAFLTHPDWETDNYNSPLALSMFCFLISQDSSIFIREWANGPQNAAYTGINAYGILIYIQKFYKLLEYPLRKTSLKLKPNNAGDNFIYLFNFILKHVRLENNFKDEKSNNGSIYDELDNLLDELEED